MQKALLTLCVLLCAHTAGAQQVFLANPPESLCYETVRITEERYRSGNAEDWSFAEARTFLNRLLGRGNWVAPTLAPAMMETVHNSIEILKIGAPEEELRPSLGQEILLCISRVRRRLLNVSLPYPT